MSAPVTPPAAAAITSTSPPPPWPGLLPDLLSEILTHLYPADVARFRVVSRAWHSAARRYPQQLPWVVLPNGSFGTMSGNFFRRVPGLPDNVTCIGATANWLALDCTDDVSRRTNRWDTYDSTAFKFLKPRHDVRHKHNYILYNPFSGKTVSLSELDCIVGDVPETFEIRKVLMRYSSTGCDDDLVVVTTNRQNHAIIICRPGAEKKGRFVIPHLGIWDVAFFEDALYGITEHKDLVVFDLGKNKDGEPIVSGFKRVIIGHPPLGDGEDPLSWMDDYQTINIDDDEDDEEATAEYVDDDVMIVGDGAVVVKDEKVPYETKDYIVTTRRLVESCGGGGGRKYLLMVRHQGQFPAFHAPDYTRKVDIFKADLDAGQWVLVTATALAQGEALFLSRSTSRVTQAYRDIKEGFVYSVDMDDAFDVRSNTRTPVSLPWQRKQAVGELLTWVFPPQPVLWRTSNSIYSSMNKATRLILFWKILSYFANNKD